MKQGCIYRIINLLDNKCYIGSSISHKKRFARHLYDLKNNIHHNSYLQRAWNKYGEENFSFEVIMWCNIEELFLWEEAFYIVYKSFAYNTNDCFSKPPSRLGKPHSDETKKKMSLKQLGRQLPQEQREKLKGNKNCLGRIYSDETREKIRASQYQREFQLISPLGEIKTIKNMSKFCKDNQLFASNIRKVLRGIRPSHKGWKAI